MDWLAARSEIDSGRIGVADLSQQQSEHRTLVLAAGLRARSTAMPRARKPVAV